MRHQQAASSSSFTNEDMIYDVFLNFRGEDTRTGFAGNLYHALREKGIRSFMDDEGLKRGEEITPALLKAIEQSRMAIIIFSKNYASSTYCLNELVEILHIIKGEGRQVWPVFYDVTPTDVRHQRGTFAEAFTKHHKKCKDNRERVQEWRDALHTASNICGWHRYEYEYEYAFIQKIIKEILEKIKQIRELERINKQASIVKVGKEKGERVTEEGNSREEKGGGKELQEEFSKEEQEGKKKLEGEEENKLECYKTTHVMLGDDRPTVPYPAVMYLPPPNFYEKYPDLHLIFNDENPNSCSVM